MKVDYAHIGPTCVKIGDMEKYGREVIGRWPKFYRDDLGADIKAQMRKMLTLATRARLKYYNKTTLTDLDIEKEVLKVLLREANETLFTARNGEKRQLLSDHSYGVWAEQVTEIGKLIGGWINAIQSGNGKSARKSGEDAGNAPDKATAI